MEVRPAFRKLVRAAAAVMLVGLLLQSGWPLHAELAAIRAYQMGGSPLVGLVFTCRFKPSCSHYAQIVLEREGLARGNWLILKRLVRCSPLGWALDTAAGHTSWGPARGKAQAASSTMALIWPSANSTSSTVL